MTRPSSGRARARLDGFGPRCSGDQVGQGFALDRCHEGPAQGDAVVAGGWGPGQGADLVGGEPVGVALVGVDDDLEAGVEPVRVGPGLERKAPSERKSQAGSPLKALPGCPPIASDVRLSRPA